MVLALGRYEVEEEGCGLRLPREVAQRREVDARVRVRIGRVPARDRRVVEEPVVDVPAEDDVAEAQPAVSDSPELVERHVLSAKDAVDVEPADLDALDTALFELGPDRVQVRCLRGFGH